MKTRKATSSDIGPRRLFDASSRGFSLIEVLVAVGILGILALAISTLIVNQAKMTQHLRDKIEFAEVHSTIIQSFTDANVCSAHLQNQMFDATSTTTTTASPTVIQLPALRSGPLSTSPIIVEANQLLPFSNTLEVASIEFKNILSTGNPHEYIGTFEVRVTNTSGGISLKPISFQQAFFINPASLPASALITHCQGLNVSAYTLTVNQLYLYTAATVNAFDCGTIVEGPETFRANTGCARFCKQDCHSVGTYTCQSINPGPIYPVGAFSTGVVTECDSITNPLIHAVRCDCIR